MKDALGHGSNPRGEHSGKIDQLGKPVMHVGAYYSKENPDRPSHVEVSYRAPTPEEAAAVRDTYPKSIGFKGDTIGVLEKNGDYRYEGFSRMRADLHPNGVHGAVNETGVKRYQSFLKNARKLGHRVEEHTVNGQKARNQYGSLDEFHRKIGVK